MARPVSDRKTKPTWWRIEESIKDNFDRICKAKGYNPSTLIELWIKEFILKESGQDGIRKNIDLS